MSQHKKNLSTGSTVRISESDHNEIFIEPDNMALSRTVEVAVPNSPTSPSPRPMTAVGSVSCIKVFGRIIFDLCCCVLVFLPWIILHTVGSPFHRGFYCDDLSLRYPYHESTVSSEVAVVGGLILGLVVIISIECFFVVSGSCRGKTVSKILFCGCSVPYCFIDSYKVIVVYLFGCATQQTVVNIGKYTVGSLRPHFIDVCQPNFTAIECTKNGLPQYITDYECLGTDDKALWDMRLSFPSGHSSIALYYGVFLVLYLQYRLPRRQSTFIKYIIQSMLIWLAVWVALTRISDYKHHAIDVFCGGLIGATFGALAVMILFREVWRKSKIEKESHKPQHVVTLSGYTTRTVNDKTR